MRIADINIIEKLCSLNGKIIKRSIGLAIYGHLSGHCTEIRPLTSAVVKNQYLHESAILLLKNGYYSSSNQLIRTSIEANVIGKYICITNDQTLTIKWMNDEYVNIINEIVNKLKSSNFESLRSYLKNLHKVTHATVYSQQVVDSKSGSEAFDDAVSLLRLSLLIQYHVNSQVFMTRQIKYLLKKYGGFVFTSVPIRKAVNSIKSGYGIDGKRIYREMCHKWSQ